MAKTYDVIAQKTYDKYIEHLIAYLSFKEEERIGRNFGCFPDIQFMSEIEEKMLCIIKASFLPSNGWTEPVPSSIKWSIVHDKARIYIFNLLKIHRVMPTDPVCGSQTGSDWDAILSIKQLIDGYLEKHPELIREHRLITDDWKPSSES